MRTTLPSNDAAMLDPPGAGLFIRIDRLLVLDHADIHQHGEHIRDAVDMNDLVVLELEPGETPHVDLLTLRRNAHVRAAGLLAEVMAQHADFIVSAPPRLDGTIEARRKRLVQ